MIGLDTNVLVRFVMRDDPAQSLIADSVMASLTSREPGYISHVVLVELWWVLRRNYKRSVDECTGFLEEIVNSDELKVENIQAVKWAIERLQRGADLADSLIVSLAEEAGCQKTVTFDQKAASRAGMTLLTPDVN